MKKSVFALFVAIACASIACSESPLLNHADADQQQGTGANYDKESGGERQGSSDSVYRDGKLCSLKFQEFDRCAVLHWIEMPTSDKAGSFELTFDAPEPDATVSVRLWMSVHGHGSSPVKVSRGGDDRSWVATDVFFVMKGPWEIWVDVKRADGTLDRAKLDFVF